ncbi:MAG TPA: VPLPA-CTERM sorting domain-containing protein [Nitrospiraceae bacterium]|nr:VPLPA-CTERM sorting domain-containing protein [Nitrospiraceae bacterium]
MAQSLAQRFWRAQAKILVVMFAATMGIGGFGSEARAFTINSGDLVLSVYGNGTEYYRDLGPASSLLTPATQTLVDLNLSTLNPMLAVGGTNPVEFTLVRNTFGSGIPASSTFINAGSQLNTADTLASGNSYSVSQTNGAIRSWQGLISSVSAPLGNELLLAASDPASFTSTMGVDGSLKGSFTGFGMQGTLGTTLTILQGVVSGNVLSDAGAAVLMANGQLLICGGAGCTPSAVPLPAAAVLFGTGLVGLVTIARRKLN